MSEKKITIHDFSEHLFWDVDKNTLDLEKQKAYIVQRVLEYGLMKDWRNLTKLFTIQDIGRAAKEVRDLDPVSMSFISTVSKIPTEQFKCYSTKQSLPKHWNF
jgi:hypothetical protein